MVASKAKQSKNAKAPKAAKAKAPKAKKTSAKPKAAAKSAKKSTSAKKPTSAKTSGIPKGGLIPKGSKPPSVVAAEKAGAPKRGPSRPVRGVDARAQRAEHEHQDPRSGQDVHKPTTPLNAPGTNQNYGEFKNKAVARMDNVSNWFRRGKGR